MLLSVKYRFVFVHVGKNGGNAITAALKPFSSPGYWDGDSSQKHWPAFRIRDELLLDSWHKYYSFGFVSNPWRWLHSSYYYIVMTALLYGSTPISRQLAEWKKWTIKNPDEYTKRWIKEAHDNAEKGFKTFVVDECNDFMKRFPGGQIRKWLQDENGRDIVSHVGKYENLADEWPALCSKIGLDTPPLSALNPTILADGSSRAEHDYRLEYSPALNDLVKRAFFIDIERMGYTIEA